MRGHLQGLHRSGRHHRRSDRHRRRADDRIAGLRPLEPMIDTAERELRAAGVDERAATILAGAGYRHLEQMQNIVARGTRFSFRRTPADARHRGPAGTAAPTPSCAASWPPNTAARFTASASTWVEPVFADTKFNRRLDRFLRRGRAAARTEWRLITATHNLLSQGPGRGVGAARSCRR